MVPGTEWDFSVIRLNPDGSLDDAFGAANFDGLANATHYTEGAGPAPLSTAVRIRDDDLAALDNGQGNYAGASVSLARQGGADAQDVFSALGNLAFTGSDAVLSGTNVGTVYNGGGRLTIAFNANASQARVDEVLSSLAYANSSDTPSATVVVEWTFSDGNTGSQGSGGALAATGSTTVAIEADEPSPVVVHTLVWSLLEGEDGLPGVAITGGPEAATTDAAGRAEFTATATPALPLTATLEPAGAMAAASSAAVTLQDAVAILKMIAGGVSRNDDNASKLPFQALAADFDGSGVVSLADALGVLRHAVGQPAPRPAWVFVDAEDPSRGQAPLLEPGLPPALSVPVTPPGPAEVTLFGVLRGDVDGSFALPAYGAYGG